MERIMKLLHVVGESKFGGGSVIILDLARMARDLGWEVDVLTTDPALIELLEENGIGVVYLNAIWRNIRPVRDLVGLWRLYRFLRRNPYTLVHTHTSKGGFVGRLAAKMAGVPAIVHTVHGFAFHEQSQPSALRVYAALERRAAGWCHRIVTVSEFHRQWGLSLGIGDEKKMVAIPNGIAPERIAVMKGREATRAAYGIGPEDFLIVSIGRLADGKGLDDLLEAVAAVRGQISRPLKLWLPGTGPIQNMLEQTAAGLRLQGVVHFLGFRQDVGDLLAAADLVALPSLREGLSIALLEAMAMEKPIVATSIGSNREVTREGECAHLIAPRDRTALAAAIVKMANEPGYARKLAAAAAARFRSGYTNRVMLDRYSAEYDKVLSECMPAAAADEGEPFGKRAIDVILSGAALLLLSPLLLGIAAAVRLTSPGPALFRQKRLGRGGREFTLYKFRTMAVNAPDLRNADGSAWSSPDDPRVTRLGHFLRNSSLDELPQLINVFKGDMSLVGPRPELPDQIRFYSDTDKRRLCARPGLTGLAQISGRNEIPWERRRQLDVEYIDRRSLSLDARVLCQTVTYVLRRQGIHTSRQKEPSL
jgi:lipopolysaccharide/colanic/teichoic acid biosynthesis glycosyltransferase/glycosyltransferase involved in cell wall biosynthesis